MFEATGMYKKIMTPVWEEAGDEEADVTAISKVVGAGEVIDLGNGFGEIVEYQDLKVRMAWPEIFTPAELDIKRAESDALGMADFARMYLLDLARAKGIHLKREWITDYAVEKIMKNWKIIFGVDYASATDQRKLGKIDYFSVSIGAVIPWGGVILLDGYMGVLTQGEAEMKLKAMYDVWRPYKIGMEAIGSGQEFYKLLVRTTSLPVIDYTSSKSKGVKFENEMGPMFQYGRAFVSSNYTKFILEFIKAWINWDGSGKTVDDPLDSTYYLLRTAVVHLMPRHEETDTLRAKEIVSNLDSSPHFGRRLD